MINDIFIVISVIIAGAIRSFEALLVVSHVAKILVAPPLPLASLMGRRLTRAPVGGALSMLATHSAPQIPAVPEITN